jgi:hypothetical protein
MWRGFRCRCPKCWKGHLFGKYLKVADHCEECGEEFSSSPRRRFSGLSRHHRRGPYHRSRHSGGRERLFAAVLVATLDLATVDAGELACSPAADEGCNRRPAMADGMHGFEAAKKRRLEQFTITASTASPPATNTTPSAMTTRC